MDSTTRFNVEQQGGGRLLVYTLEEGECIDSFSIGMISNTKINGLLPFIFTQINDTKHLKYVVTGKTPLRRYFEGTVNSEKLTCTFIGIINVLLAADEYMLAQGKFVIDADLVFVDVASKSVELLFLPLEGEPLLSIPYQLFFKALVFPMKFDSNENRDYVASIMSFLNDDENFSLQAFRKMLQRISDMARINVIPNPPRPPVIRSPVIPGANGSISSGPVNNPQSNAEQPIIRPVAPAPSIVRADSAPPVIGNNPAGNGRMNPIPPTPPSSVGFEVPINNRLSPGGVPGKNRKVEENVSVDKKSGLLDALFGKKQEQKKKSVSGKNKESHTPDRTPLDSIPIITAGGHGSYPISDETVVLNIQADGGTVLLNSQYQIPAFLIRKINNERFAIIKPKVKVGKNRKVVDYYVNNPTISRVHAEIQYRNGVYLIKDNASLNGTYVDGIRIDANAEVPLADQSTIILSDEVFLFSLQ